MSWPPSDHELTCVPPAFVDWLVEQAPESILRSEAAPEAARHRMLFAASLMASKPEAAREAPLRETRAVLASHKAKVRQVLAASIAARSSASRRRAAQAAAAGASMGLMPSHHQACRMVNT